MTVSYEPQVLHGQFLLSDQEMIASNGAIEDLAKRHMTAVFADALAPLLVELKGGAVLSPLTWTINKDMWIGVYQLAGTINVQQLPDPDEGMFYLRGGPMDGRLVRVGDPAPKRYDIPIVLPVHVSWTIGTDAGATAKYCEYRRIPGTTGYEFVRQYG